jgi:cyclopropane-fatty-acyl-phospholipid synthase
MKIEFETGHGTDLELLAGAGLSPSPISYGIHFREGEYRLVGEDKPRFELLVNDEAQLRDILEGSAYHAALHYVHGRFDVKGDLEAAIAFKALHTRRGPWMSLRSLFPLIAASGLESFHQSKARAARNICFHYDRSNAFYRSFLDVRMVYSCAYFRSVQESLDDAQLAKLDHICRKLDIQRRETFLDIGCGWGALVFRAAQRYGALAAGCTLSHNQFEFATRQVAEKGLAGEVKLLHRDYRDIQGHYQKIASVGMFEHVGRRRLPEYFRTVHQLLDRDGLFLNHGIVRAPGTGASTEMAFLRKWVFPGGDLITLGEVIRQAEAAGFEVLDVECLRPHYVLTCRAWVDRLKMNADACRQEVGEETYRTWLLYLACSALSFDQGDIGVYQILMSRRDNKKPHRLTRDYLYA